MTRTLEHDLPKRAFASVLVLALLSLSVVVTVTGALATTHPTALAGVGPTGDDGFPEWFQDDEGTRLVPCFGDELACHFDAEELPTPGGDVSFPDNFPQIFFYYAADAHFADPGSVDVRVAGFELAGGFDNPDHAVVDGDQAVFNEMQFSLRGLTPGGRYTIEHPYGVHSGTASDTGRLRILAEGSNPLSGPVTRFLLPADGPTADGFLSDGQTPVQVTGSPVDRNYVRISGPGVDIQTDEFILHGELFEPDKGASTPSAAPASATAVPGAGQATVTWQGVPIAADGGAPITQYRITSDPAGVDELVRASARTHTVTGLTNGTPYVLHVAAVNAIGHGPTTAAPAVTPSTIPADASAVSAAAGDRSVTVSWEPPTDDGGSPVTGYQVQRAPDGPWQTLSADARSTTFSDLTNGTSYRFEVRAVNANGAGPSTAAPAVTPSTIPAGASAVSAAAGDRSVTVSWRPPTDDGGSPVTGYEARHAPDGPWQMVSAEARSTTFSNLTNGTAYRFEVRAVNANGAGPSTRTAAVRPVPVWITDGIPLSGDWNADGRSTPGWFHNGTFYLRNANTPGAPHVTFQFGRRGDVPVVGDWNGNGRDTVGVRRGRTWLLRNRNSAGPASLTFDYGRATDTAVTGDWNGNGRDTIGVRRGTSWMLRNANSAGAASLTFAYGRATDTPVVGDWNRNGKDTIGVRRGRTWLLRNANSAGAASVTVVYGASSARPVVGDWNANGRDTIGTVRGFTWQLRNSNTAGDPNLTFLY
jgi:hypothetical protein